MKVYTRTGDGGETSLFSGGRVGKDHHRLEAYGTLDELNSVLGVLRAEPLPDAAVGHIEKIQSSLFALGAVLADARGRYPADPAQWRTAPVEAWIDGMEAELEPLKNFILPGGCREACLAHLARTVCRRAERRVVAVADADQGDVPDGVIEYLNRLSDALFVCARWLNFKRGIDDVQWHPDPPADE
jgi:cob(I)alamin adenosyltransferase